MGFASFVLVLSSNALSVVVGCISILSPCFSLSFLLTLPSLKIPKRIKAKYNLARFLPLFTFLLGSCWLLVVSSMWILLATGRLRRRIASHRARNEDVYVRIYYFSSDICDRFVQGLFVFLRAMQQQIRYPIGFCFDIFLPILSAVFLGLIYHGRVYTPPIITALDPNGMRRYLIDSHLFWFCCCWIFVRASIAFFFSFSSPFLCCLFASSSSLFFSDDVMMIHCFLCSNQHWMSPTGELHLTAAVCKDVSILTHSRRWPNTT